MPATSGRSSGPWEIGPRPSGRPGPKSFPSPIGLGPRPSQAQVRIIPPPDFIDGCDCRMVPGPLGCPRPNHSQVQCRIIPT
eukprot:5807489-Karenia_brevis.AAC.1